MSGAWDCHWTFSSPHVLENAKELASRLSSDARDPNWNYLREYNFDSRPKTIDNTSEAGCDIDALVRVAVVSIRSETLASCEHQFKDVPTSACVCVFDKVRSELSESDFTKFCKNLSSLNEPRLLDVCFDVIIHAKLTEREEASLSTVNDIKDLARHKPEHVSKCIIKLITNESSEFSDLELLENVYEVVPECQKEAIVMAIINTDNFKERSWKLLQALPLKPNSRWYSEVINCMSNRCEEYGKSQIFAKFLLHMCKNVESDQFQEMLKSIVDKNETILKRQMLKALLIS